MARDVLTAGSGNVRRNHEVAREPRKRRQRLTPLTDDEAITLRRIAFSASDVRLLRRANVDRLLRLRLIAEARNNSVLTISGKEHFDSLPRSLFAAGLRQRNGW